LENLFKSYGSKALLPKNLNSEEFFNFNSSRHRRDLSRIADATKFHLDSIDNIGIISPKTGKLLTSTISLFFYFGRYRCQSFMFEEEGECFFLVTGDFWNEKIALYYPSNNLIIRYQSHYFSLQYFNQLQIFLRRNKSRIEKLTKKNNKKIGFIFSYGHFAHHLWNELSALEMLQKRGDLAKID